MEINNKIMIKEQELIDVGFLRADVSPEEAGTKTGYYYYDYDLIENNYTISLISQCSDEIKNDNWVVNFFEAENVVFNTIDDIKHIINIFKKHTVKNNG